MIDVVGVVVVEIEHDPQRVDERQCGRVSHQRHLIAGNLDRDPGGAERAPQRRDALAPRADQHRHVVPLDAVLQVGAPEQVGQVLGLAAVAVEGPDHDAALAVLAAGRGRVEERVTGRLGDAAGQPDPLRDPLGGGEDPWAEPPGRAERDHLGGLAVGPREVVGEVEDASHLGAAEGIDRLMGVADRDQVAALPGDGLQHRDLTGVGVLVLVHEDVCELGAQLVAVQGRLDGGAADQVGVVDGAAVVEDGEVLLEERSRGHELREP